MLYTSKPVWTRHTHSIVLLLHLENKFMGQLLKFWGLDTERDNGCGFSSMTSQPSLARWLMKIWGIYCWGFVLIWPPCLNFKGQLPDSIYCVYCKAVNMKVGCEDGYTIPRSLLFRSFSISLSLSLSQNDVICVLVGMKLLNLIFIL